MMSHIFYVLMSLNPMIFFLFFFFSNVPPEEYQIVCPGINHVGPGYLIFYLFKRVR